MKLQFWRKEARPQAVPFFATSYELADYLVRNGYGERSRGERGGPQVVTFPLIVRRDPNLQRIARERIEPVTLAHR